MIILGLDPGTQLGWALWANGALIESGVQSFASVADQGFGRMFIAFRSFLARMRREHGPLTAIAYELPFTGFGAAITGRITTGMAAHVLERCATWRCRPVPVNVATLKKWATGNGRATKDEMIDAARRCVYAYGGLTQPMSEHEADAIHVARWAAEYLAEAKGGETCGNRRDLRMRSVRKTE